MKTTMQRHLRAAWLIGACACVAACSSYSVRVGGAPEVAVRNCVAAAPRELKVPQAAIVVDSGTTPRDGLYAINLKVGPQGRSAVCTVDENGAVLSVVFKRPE
jgi:hypothetical protein